jgi:hypothetical protein
MRFFNLKVDRLVLPGVFLPLVAAWLSAAAELIGMGMSIYR